MSKRHVKKYPLEFKQSSARLAAESKQPISTTAKELGINKVTLHGWVKHYYPSSQTVSSITNDDMLSEIKRLRKENSRLKQERDILKKAAAYFASETL